VHVAERSEDLVLGRRCRTMSVDPKARFVVVGPGEAEVIAWRARMHLLAGADNSENRLAILETENPPKAGPPLHRHNREDEAFYVLEGEYTFECGGRVVSASAGSFVFLPKGIPHRYQVGNAGGRLLMVFAPGGIEDYFRAVATAMEDGPLPSSKAHEIAHAYGIDLLDEY
jgi:quercetin dioxygenase-like cupin family protein